MEVAGCTPSELIRKTTETPGLFVFSELFDNPIIKSLDEKDSSRDLALLRLFCYGTYNDYKMAQTSYPPLTPLQVRKLRQLSIISACYSQKLIPYDRLLQMLELSSLRELEDLIIELFYLEAACGKLDQQKGLLVVESAIGRDLRETELPKLRSDLEAWCNRVDVVVSEVVGEMEKAKKLKHDWEVGRAALAEKVNLLNSLGKKDSGKFDPESLMEVEDWIPHPDILTEGGSQSQPKLAPLMGSPSQAGDRDPRGRKNPLKSMRSGKKSK
nr:unnamed protein product [Spirometra erinaceieuropaei]